MNITYRGRHNILYQLQSSEDRKFYRNLMGNTNGVWLYGNQKFTTTLSDLLPVSGAIHKDVSLLFFDQYNTCCVNFSNSRRQSIYTNYKTFNDALIILKDHNLIEDL